MTSWGGYFKGMAKGFGGSKKNKDKKESSNKEESKIEEKTKNLK